MIFSEIPDKEKKEYFREWGWHLTLFDKERSFSAKHHPFVDLKIYWSKEENDVVLDYVNTMWFFGEECKAEDISIYMNQLSTPCHNPSAGLRFDSQLAERLIDEGVGWVSVSDPKDIQFLKDMGLDLEFSGRFSRYGKMVDKDKVEEGVVCIGIKDNPDSCIVPEKMMKITSTQFRDWFYEQDRFLLQEREPDLGDLEACCEFIKEQE